MSDRLFKNGDSVTVKEPSLYLSQHGIDRSRQGIITTSRPPQPHPWYAVSFPSLGIFKIHEDNLTPVIEEPALPLQNGTIGLVAEPAVREVVWPPGTTMVDVEKPVEEEFTGPDLNLIRLVWFAVGLFTGCAGTAAAGYLFTVLA